MSNDMLRDSPLFRSLPSGEFGPLVRALRPHNIDAGEILFREGDIGERMYIIIEGELEVITGLDTPDEHLVAVNGAGNIVGEMSLLVAEGRRTASVRGRGPVKLFELRLSDFEELLEKSPIMAYRLLQELGRRLQNLTIELSNKVYDLNRAYEDLKAAQAELVEKEKMEHELAMARQIQENILPAKFFTPPDCDLGAKMVPARAVGGDFFDIIKIDEHTVGVAIGDVSDKGVPAALFMAQFCTLLRLQAQHSKEPDVVLQEINNHLLPINRAGMFVTAIYGIYDSQKRTFTYARAGHEVPVIFDVAGNARELDYAQGMPLCIFPDSPLDLQTVTIPPGHTLLMYTDGGTDAMDASKGFFGLENLQETVGDYLNDSAQTLCDAVVDKLQAFQPDGHQFDDITLVAIRSL